MEPSGETLACYCARENGPVEAGWLASRVRRTDGLTTADGRRARVRERRTGGRRNGTSAVVGRHCDTGDSTTVADRDINALSFPKDFSHWVCRRSICCYQFVVH